MLKIVVVFNNIGGYHVARLSAFKQICDHLFWKILVIQETGHAVEHPWGDFTNLSSLPIKTLISSCQLTSILDEYVPDVLVIPGWGFSISRNLLRWKKRNRKIAILMSESKQDDAPRTWCKESLKRYLYLRHFDTAIVGGIKHKQYLINLRFPKDKIFYGYDIVDNQYFLDKTCESLKFDTIRSSLGIPSYPYFLSVTRLIPRKNIIGLIHAYLQYRQMSYGQTWDLVICGSGVEESRIKTILKKYDISDFVHFPGFISYQDIPHWYAFAGAFIHPALQEQWGLVVNEAMASGLPVLVSNRCGCFPELVLEGVNGFGFDPENIGELRDLMLRVSSDQIDRIAMGKAAQEHIANFSPEHFAQGMKCAIEVALGNRA